MSKNKLIGLVLFLVILSGCTSSGGSDSSGGENPPSEQEYRIVVNGSTQKTSTFSNENVIMTEGCVVSKLFDSSGAKVIFTDGSAYVSNGEHLYIGTNYYNNGLNAYAVLYANSMTTQPEEITNGTQYSLKAGESIIKKLTLNSSMNVLTNYYSVGVQVYNENLDYLEGTSCSFCQGDKTFSLNQGTYYFVFSSGSCKNDGNTISINIF